jgi:ureidoglycolate dehydrogenase (NAD+)
MRSISVHALQELAEAVLRAAGADRADAAAVAEVLVWADRRGRHPQGTIWLEVLAGRLRDGDLASPAAMTTDARFPALAVVDAANGFGHVAGRLAVELLRERAPVNGVAAIAVHSSSHFGPCGYYAAELAASGLIGIATTNAYPKVAVPGSRAPVLGTNPLGFGAPVAGHPPVIGDLSTGSIAGSRVREALAAGRQLEPGVALDRAGRPTTDPGALDDGGVMLPFGGAKGSALGLLVEILTSVLAGGAPPEQLGSMFAPGPARTSHFFLAIAGDEQIGARLGHLRAMILAAPVGEEAEIRLPGDAGHRLERRGGNIVLPTGSVSAVNRAAALVNLGHRLD